MSRSKIIPYHQTGEHSYHRRAIAHNYYAPFIYHITLKKSQLCEPFGYLTGDARIAPGLEGSAKIVESTLGKIIAKAILRLPHALPKLALLQFCVMPDHVHLLLQVVTYSEYHLDYYIDYLKARVRKRYSEAIGRVIAEEEIFEKGYCDKPLYNNRSLNSLYDYIRENPHRLAMRRQYPEFFRRIRKLQIGTREYEAYGNLFLYRNPDKEALKISSKFTPEEREQKEKEWLSGVAEGRVLVSPFISPAERKIRTEAEEMGGNIILITHEAFPERFKPAAHDFALCCEGRLMIISLGLSPKTALSRQICLEMNALAALIASQG